MVLKHQDHPLAVSFIIRIYLIQNTHSIPKGAYIAFLPPHSAASTSVARYVPFLGTQNARNRILLGIPKDGFLRKRTYILHFERCAENHHDAPSVRYVETCGWGFGRSGLRSLPVRTLRI